MSFIAVINFIGWSETIECLENVYVNNWKIIEKN